MTSAKKTGPGLIDKMKVALSGLFGGATRSAKPALAPGKVGAKKAAARRADPPLPTANAAAKPAALKTAPSGKIPRRKPSVRKTARKKSGAKR